MVGVVTKHGFEPNQKEFGLHVRSPIAQRPALQIARKIAERANGTAPFAPKVKGDRRRRHQKGSYKVKPVHSIRVGKHTRAGAEVYSDVIEASVDEFGTQYRKPRRTLLKAGIAVSIEELGRYDGTERG